MLLNDFYRILEIESSADDNEIKAKVEINEKHKIFEGHFAGNPVVPGVCMVQIVKEVLCEIKGQDLNLTIGSNIKFLSVINPEINKYLFLTIKLKEISMTEIHVTASIVFEEARFFSFKGVFTKIISKQ